MIHSPLKIKSRLRTVMLILLVLIPLLPIWWWTGLRYRENLIAGKRALADEFLAIQGRYLSTEINSRLAGHKDLKAFVDAHIGNGHGIPAAEFTAFTSGLLCGKRSIRSVSSAPELDKALEEILSQRRKRYDPVVIDACRCVFIEKDFRMVT